MTAGEEASSTETIRAPKREGLVWPSVSIGSSALEVAGRTYTSRRPNWIGQQALEFEYP